MLHLDLKELTLQLLGLNAHLDRVVLDITGDPQGWCARLTVLQAGPRQGGLSAGRDAACAQRPRPRPPGSRAALLGAADPKASTAAAGATCPVLDLVVGPLNLQLLGLVVDLQRVHLSVTAARGAGALGDLFCKLADSNPTTTTSSTTT